MSKEKAFLADLKAVMEKHGAWLTIYATDDSKVRLELDISGVHTIYVMANNVDNYESIDAEYIGEIIDEMEE